MVTEINTTLELTVDAIRAVLRVCEHDYTIYKNVSNTYRIACEKKHLEVVLSYDWMFNVYCGDRPVAQVSKPAQAIRLALDHLAS